jgi:hypothetical protein
MRADTRLAGVKVSVHGGQFSDEELRGFGAQAPAIVVSALRATHTDQGGISVLDVFMCAVVLERDRALAALTGDKDARGLALVDAFMRVINRLDPAVAGASRPKKPEARNAYGPAWREKGLSCWVVTWQQTIELTDTTVWNDFTTLDTKYDITPRDNGAPLGQVPEAEDTQELA